MKIFWSWQSDIKSKISKDFVKEVIEETLSEIHEELELTERPEIDHDTKGVKGSPAIADTIFEKITEADLFLGDVTPIAENENKKIMNPNVAIELGYAIAMLGDEKIMTIMNSYYGGVGDLPFDLRHKRGPVTYLLSPEASKEDIAKEKNRLRGVLKKIFKDYLNTKPSVTNEPEGLSCLDFYKNDEPIVRLSEGVNTVNSKEYFVPQSPIYVYCTIKPLKDISYTKIELKDEFGGEINNHSYSLLLNGNANIVPTVNKYGLLVFRLLGGEVIDNFTQIFEDLKMISVSHSIVYPGDNLIPLTVLNSGLLHFSTQAFQRLENIFSKQGIETTYRLEIGIKNNNSILILPDLLDGRFYRNDGKRGPLLQDFYSIACDVSSESDIKKLVKSFTQMLFQDLGLEFDYDQHRW